MAARQLRMMAHGRPGRLPLWPERLSLYVTASVHAPFAWGSRDCCLWAAEWVHLCTGYHPARDLLGTYSDAEGARRAIEREGGFVTMVSARMRSAASSEPLHACRGDLVAVPGVSDIPALGVLLGSKVAVMTPRGLTKVPVTESRHAWAVG